ncbi:MAG: mandelate racemase/muconate lactonizing enzyme family protein [Rhodospirillales bacterium]|jgi:galactonate dehydratase|nr:mandelate racemase/muconate lactonizing enzyme family protein [Rhodospirillales bacterium]
MTGKPTITDISCQAVRISPQTQWTFIEVTDSDGLVGTGEATHFGSEDPLRTFANIWDQRLTGLPAEPEALAPWFGSPPSGLPERAVLCAIEQALWDISGQRSYQPVADLLGDRVRDVVSVYANTNRGTVDRSPEGFVAATGLAVDAGFDHVKIAPFDDVGEGKVDDEALFSAGLERIEAVNAACAGRTGVMVDCHWRLDETRTIALLDKAAALGLYWIECPLPETEAHFTALGRIAAHAKSVGVRLAGMEHGLSPQDFQPYIDNRIYDVLMPDVKYCGLSALRTIADMAAPKGIAVSPHNPTGPVCHVASVQVSAILKNFLMLEFQFGESSLFFDIVTGDLVPPDGNTPVFTQPGLGVALDHDCIARLSQNGT